jgi:hypothetical protein
MPADYLDADLAIAEVDPNTQEIKATPYFEDYLYKVIATLGGEGSTLIGDLFNTTIEADKLSYMFALVKSLKKQVDEINNTIDSPILDAKVKSMQVKLGELETHFDNHQIQAAVKQIQIDTAEFINLVKSVNYTAENRDFVEARSKITVTLPANPISNHQVIVSNGDGSTITIDGNGNNIKYKTTDTSLKTIRQGTSLHFQYFIDNDAAENYWRVI